MKELIPRTPETLPFRMLLTGLILGIILGALTGALTLKPELLSDVIVSG